MLCEEVEPLYHLAMDGVHDCRKIHNELKLERTLSGRVCVRLNLKKP
jgi:hypothetical protein